MHCKSYSHFFSKKNQHICVSLDVNFNESLTNDMVSFEQPGPVFKLFRFTLLVGKPPFETSSLKDTYTKIKKNEYHVPSRVSPCAKNLIIKLLKSDPSERPGMGGLLEDEFFTSGKFCSLLDSRFSSFSERNLLGA